MNNINKFIRWWQGANLPDRYVFLYNKKNSTDDHNLIILYFKNWLLHPIKRRLARYYLLFLKRFFKLKVIGITGSMGKTSTKEMIASVLSIKGQTVKSYQNIDPIYNIPSTILKCKPSTKYLVLKMGIEYPGEMDFYLWLAQPDIGVITNINPTHTLYLKDIEGVFKEKSKLVTSLYGEKLAVLNFEDNYLRKLGRNLKAEVIWFGDNTDIKSVDERIYINGNTEFTLILNKKNSQKLLINLPILGNQFVKNSLAAIAVCYRLGYNIKDIKKGIESTKFPGHRMKIFKIGKYSYLLDDSYNNNPSAARETIKTFLEISKTYKKIVIFGDMLELGTYEKQYHKSIGNLLGKSEISFLIGVGAASRILVEEAARFMGKQNTMWVANWRGALEKVRNILANKQVVLVKGSRSIALDKLTELLLKEYNETIIFNKS